MKKVIVAFSGGLDTSFCIPYLKEQGFDVITAIVNTGGFTSNELKAIAASSKKLGASKHYEVDAQQQLYDDFATYLLKANYMKGGVYPACVGPERNVIAIETAKIAKKEKTNYVAHGSTGAGNDQVRFDLSLKALLPDCVIIAPIRDEGLSREYEIEFLEKHGFKLTTGKKDYSINIGLLGTTISGKETLTTTKELPDDAFPNVKSLANTKATADVVKIEFKKGLPVGLNGQKMTGIMIIKTLDKIAESHGIGKDYHIGTTILGTKGRIGFESPAMKVLIKAHTELEKLTLTSKQIFWKNTLGTVYGDLIHEGLYFDPVIKDIEAMMNSASEFVEGIVEIKLFKGTMTVVSLDSKYSLFNSKLGTYGEKTGAWSGLDAKGFCKIYGTESANAFITHLKNE